MIPRGDVAMSDDAETIAQLQAELGELLRRIDDAVTSATRHATAAERVARDARKADER